MTVVVDRPRSKTKRHAAVRFGLMSAPDVETGGQRPTSTFPVLRKGKCVLGKRRRKQLFALGLGLLEVGFSVYNAVAEGAFEVKDAEGFVFSASAIVETVGLAVLLLVAVGPLCRKSTEEAGEARDEKEEEGTGKEGAELDVQELGSPLAILVNEIVQKNSQLTNAGYVGSICQAATVCVLGLVLLYKVAMTTFVATVCTTMILLMLWSCCTLYSLRSYGFLFLIRSGVSSVLALLPVVVDVAEAVFLLLDEGESWRAVVLAILDIVVAFCVVVPWGLQRCGMSLAACAFSWWPRWCY